MTTRPFALYVSAHARTEGMWRSQVMERYVQTSMRTTLPRRSAGVSGFELIHGPPPSNEGSVPSTASGVSDVIIGFTVDLPSVDGPQLAVAGITSSSMATSRLARPDGR